MTCPSSAHATYRWLGMEQNGFDYDAFCRSISADEIDVRTVCVDLCPWKTAYIYSDGSVLLTNECSAVALTRDEWQSYALALTLNRS